MSFEVIDFHSHPFLKANEQVGAYRDVIPMSVEEFAEDMEREGVTHFCGSVAGGGVAGFDGLFSLNRDALRLREIYGEKYIPGFHVHPDYVKESCEEIDFAVKNGVRLIGELVPYSHGWSDYSCQGFSEILDYAAEKEMLFSLHPMDLDQMEIMAGKHSNVQFVFAHPGEGERVRKMIDIMEKHENVFLDLSGTGLARYGLLRKLTQTVGAERILFGTDYPVCNLKMYIGGVLGEKISDRDKELIFSGNAKRLLNL